MASRSSGSSAADTEKPVTTAAGLAEAARDLREALADNGGFQCGYCTAGQVALRTVRQFARTPQLLVVSTVQGAMFLLIPTPLLGIFGATEGTVADIGRQLLRYLAVSGLFISVALMRRAERTTSSGLTTRPSAGRACGAAGRSGAV